MIRPVRVLDAAGVYELAARDALERGELETARGLLDLAERELKRAQRIIVRRVRPVTGGAS